MVAVRRWSATMRMDRVISLLSTYSRPEISSIFFFELTAKSVYLKHRPNHLMPPKVRSSPMPVSTFFVLTVQNYPWQFCYTAIKTSFQNFQPVIFIRARIAVLGRKFTLAFPIKYFRVRTARAGCQRPHQCGFEKGR